jgi:hypothetical protein
MKGTYMTRNAALSFAFKELPRTSFKMSKKISTPLAIAAQAKT